MLFTGGIVLCSTTSVKVDHKPENWRKELKDRNLKIWRKMFECMKFCDERGME